jgi:hypothetical protein
MQHTIGGVAPDYQAKAGPSRFARVSVHDSASAAMLQGCLVVTADGATIGKVEHLMIDLHTHQLRYVVLSGRTRRSAEIAIPWNTLYFDSATARLVFYTWP